MGELEKWVAQVENLVKEPQVGQQQQPGQQQGQLLQL